MEWHTKTCEEAKKVLVQFHLFRRTHKKFAVSEMSISRQMRQEVRHKKTWIALSAK